MLIIYTTFTVSLCFFGAFESLGLNISQFEKAVHLAIRFPKKMGGGGFLNIRRGCSPRNNRDCFSGFDGTALFQTLRVNTLVSSFKASRRRQAHSLVKGMKSIGLRKKCQPFSFSRVVNLLRHLYLAPLCPWLDLFSSSFGI